MDLACQVPRSMGILQARILEWVACPTGDLPKAGIEPRCPALQADSYGLSPQGSPLWWKPPGGHRKAKHNLGAGGLCGGWSNSDSLGVGEETGRSSWEPTGCSAVLGSISVQARKHRALDAGFSGGAGICGGCGARKIAPFMGWGGQSAHPGNALGVYSSRSPKESRIDVSVAQTVSAFGC